MYEHISTHSNTHTYSCTYTHTCIITVSHTYIIAVCTSLWNVHTRIHEHIHGTHSHTQLLQTATKGAPLRRATAEYTICIQACMIRYMKHSHMQLLQTATKRAPLRRATADRIYHTCMHEHIHGTHSYTQLLQTATKGAPLRRATADRIYLAIERKDKKMVEKLLNSGEWLLCMCSNWHVY